MNPKTGRCIARTSDLGREIAAIKRGVAQETRKLADQHMASKYGDSYIRKGLRYLTRLTGLSRDPDDVAERFAARARTARDMRVEQMRMKTLLGLPMDI